MSVALLGHRRWQNGIAKELLIGRGLNEIEAEAHMATVASTRKIPLFSSAIVLAGLDVGEVQSTSSKVEDQKAAEMAAIYGTQPNGQASQTSSFAPPVLTQQAISQGSQAAAADAMALFNDEAPATSPEPVTETTQTSEGIDELYPTAPVQTIVKSGGVSLPEGMAASKPVPELIQSTTTPEPVSKQVTCQGCSTAFTIRIPGGANAVVVACPSCSLDVTVTV